MQQPSRYRLSLFNKALPFPWPRCCWQGMAWLKSVLKHPSVCALRVPNQVFISMAIPKSCTTFAEKYAAVTRASVSFEVEGPGGTTTEFLAADMPRFLHEIPVPPEFPDFAFELGWASPLLEGVHLKFEQMDEAKKYRAMSEYLLANPGHVAFLRYLLPRDAWGCGPHAAFVRYHMRVTSLVWGEWGFPKAEQQQ